MIVKAAFTSLVGKSFRALTAAVAKNANPSIFTYYCCVGRTAKRTWKMFCIHRLPAWNAIKSHLRIFQWVLISMRLRLLHHHLKSYLMIFSRVTKNNISLLLLLPWWFHSLLVEGNCFEVLLFNCPFVKSVHDQTRDKTSGETQTDAFSGPIFPSLGLLVHSSFFTPSAVVWH